MKPLVGDHDIVIASVVNEVWPKNFSLFDLQVLKPKVPVKRAVFHEITLDALVKAFEVRKQQRLHW